MKQIGLIFFSLWISTVTAHDPDRAFFTFSYEASHIKVQAEFPWTLRNAVSRSFPEAMASHDSVLIRQAFENYFRSHFKLIDDTGMELPFIRWESLPADGHGHSGNFAWYFQKGKIAEIVNTSMFALYSEQQNFHFLPNKEQALVSYPGRVKLLLASQPSQDVWMYISLGTLALFTAFSIWKYLKSF